MATVPTDRDLTFMAFMQRFSTPASCLKHLEAIASRHSQQEEYVRKGVHINPVESLWASLKRLSYGIHHHGAFKPRQRSVNRVLLRINRRSKAERPMTAWDRINDLLGQGLTARTTYKQLVRGEA